MGLSEAVGAVEEHGIEVTVRPGGDPAGHGKGELVGGPGHEAVEAEAVLQALLAGDRRRRAGRRHLRLGPSGLGCRAGRLRCGGRHGGSRPLALEFHAGFQSEATAHGVILRPEFADPSPGVATDPVAGDTGGGHEADISALLLTQGGLAQPGAERGLAQLVAENLAGLVPRFSRNAILGPAPAPARHNQPVLTHWRLPRHERRKPLQYRAKAPSRCGTQRPQQLFFRSRGRLEKRFTSPTLAPERGRSTEILCGFCGYFR